jgi:hypothetical protein
MNVVTMSDVRELVSIEDGRCVSIYMPTHPTGREGQQDEVRLKNLIAAAEQQLLDRGMRRVEAQELLIPISKLPHYAEWQQRKQGLAIFRSEATFAHYCLDVPVEEKLVVGRRFYVKHMLSAIGAKPEFFILSISRNKVRLLKATSQGCERLHPAGLPSSMKQGLNLQVADRGEQVHSGMRGGLGKEAGVFHGQGGHRDTMKDELVEYFQLINQSIRPVLRQASWPLILAGVEYEIAIFRQMSDYAHIAGEVLYGGFDYASDRKLYLQALPIAQRFYDADRQNAFKKYRALVDRHLASDDIEEILPAAHESKIDTLFVDRSAEIFGRFDPAKKTIDIVSERDPALDLVELATIQTIRHMGTLYAARRDELPSAVPMCAIFRY